MSQLCRAVYVSQAVGGAGSNLLSIAEILGVSVRNNSRDRLTGALLCHGGWFLQALEGAKVDIDRLIRRLEADTRHRDMRVLSFEPVQTRAFPDWSMGQVMVTPRIAPLLAQRALNELDGQEALALLDRAAALNPEPQR